jgi:hypothetical protein
MWGRLSAIGLDSEPAASVNDLGDDQHAQRDEPFLNQVQRNSPQIPVRHFRLRTRRVEIEAAGISFEAAICSVVGDNGFHGVLIGQPKALSSTSSDRTSVHPSSQHLAATMI